MATLNEALTLEFKGDATHYMKALGKIKRNTKSAVAGMSANFLSLGKTMAKVGAVGVAAFGGFAAVAISKAAKAEKSFANLAGLFKESTAELKGYRDEIDRISWAMGRDTVQVTEAFYQAAISAGYRSIEDSAAIVEAATKAAIAGSSEIPTAVDAITRTLTAYNLAG
nr:hypothetical protein [Armatimonadota bacterium]NIO95547.1 hypothetical protein [Armatimonadota bacterium]